MGGGVLAKPLRLVKIWDTALEREVQEAGGASLYKGAASQNTLAFAFLGCSSDA